MEDAPIFTKYFNTTGDSSPMPKFVLYSAHEENIHPVLVALGVEQLTSAPPASMIVFNFYECTSCEGLDRF